MNCHNTLVIQTVINRLIASAPTNSQLYDLTRIVKGMDNLAKEMPEKTAEARAIEEAIIFSDDPHFPHDLAISLISIRATGKPTSGY